MRTVAHVRAGWTRLWSVPFATAIGCLGINSAVMSLLYPHSNPIHDLAAPLDAVWALFYLAGGLMILGGIATTRSDVEASGCIAFSAGAIVNALVRVAVLGWH